VRGVSLEVRRGEVVVVIGPSGCGKSTFLRCINLLEEPSAGTLRVGDRSIDFSVKHSTPRAAISHAFAPASAWVSSSSTLSPHDGAAERHVGPVIVKKMARSVGRGNRAQSAGQGRPRRLHRALSAQPSGGQQQRVAHRAGMAMAPEIKLFDGGDVGAPIPSWWRVLDVMKQLATDGRP